MATAARQDIMGLETIFDETASARRACELLHAEIAVHLAVVESENGVRLHRLSHPETICSISSGWLDDELCRRFSWNGPQLRHVLYTDSCSLADRCYYNDLSAWVARCNHNLRLLRYLLPHVEIDHCIETLGHTSKAQEEVADKLQKILGGYWFDCCAAPIGDFISDNGF